MPVRIRLQRGGMKGKPFYRIVATDSRKKRESGLFMEKLGTYNPIPNRQGFKEVRIHELRTKYWLSVGAQPTETVAKLFAKYGLCPEVPRSYNPNKVLSKKAMKDATPLDIAKKLGLL
mmetsp:Transcript_20138/g.33265  ORF Transcript_20138/g.33265 Transcript_20138/m.33265 type:complete len:118 (+) Transcript_20138:84-437(+)|eukprot:CAMPEP_0203781478 /NCGR_PEP_ID=MMETSP0099_2-20121227/10272_1 /ASSEMBLY_ACC=CAM_ASM_000209 /TAXON_ID=96639 /ORGANISM=" , Strain NY0313808BC1" /LENGTH=117 /DNA_ID=CAMNT_0050682497 /DNA_START=885 /DNA_END=1238 /DNA_ORIENTATION=-